MKTQNNKKHYKSIALALSLCTIFMWFIFCTGTSIAWFQDVSPEINNIFSFADFKVEVSHRLSDGNWEVVESDTAIFDNSAIYEPGYVQVVYLKVVNKGGRPFQFQMSANVNGVIKAKNVYGDEFNLQEYLKYGYTVTNSVEAMQQSVPNREIACQLATEDLGDFTTDTFTLAPEETAYIALIVRMPKEVGNVANYRGEVIPSVTLGITVRADQIK